MKKHSLKTELSEKIVEIFEKGKNKYESRAWSTQDVKLLEDENTESLRAEGFPEELVDKEPKNNWTGALDLIVTHPLLKLFAS